MRSAPSVAAMLLVACGSLGQPEATGADSSPVSTSASQPEILVVSPNYGTNGGNDLVTIDGGPFPSSPVVTFGGQEATVLAATRDQLQVSTPATDATDWVPISVRDAEGTEVVKRKRAYQFWRDGNGLTGLWGELYRLDYLGTYWTGPGTGPYQPPPAAQVRLVFLDPSDIRYEQVWAPYLDWCEIDYNPQLQATVVDTEMEALTLSGDGGESIRLEPSASDAGYFDDLDVEPLLLSPGTTYGLDEGASNGTWPAFGLDQLVRFPTRPEILAPDIDAAFPPSVPSDFELRWEVSPSSSYMLAIVSRTTGGGAVIEERATCLLADDGQHAIPATTWSAWVPGEFLIVQLGRVSLTERTLPHNRSTSQLVGVYWVYGAVQAL